MPRSEAWDWSSLILQQPLPRQQHLQNFPPQLVQQPHHLLCHPVHLVPVVSNVLISQYLSQEDVQDPTHTQMRSATHFYELWHTRKSVLYKVIFWSLMCFMCFASENGLQADNVTCGSNRDWNTEKNCSPSPTTVPGTQFAMFEGTTLIPGAKMALKKRRKKKLRPRGCRHINQDSTHSRHINVSDIAKMCCPTSCVSHIFPVCVCWVLSVPLSQHPPLLSPLLHNLHLCTHTKLPDASMMYHHYLSHYRIGDKGL